MSTPLAHPSPVTGTTAGSGRAYPLAWLWPVGLTVMLCGSVGICVATAVIATRDPSFALEPDYYNQAVAWDESASARDASAALGWSASARIGATAPHTGVRTLTLSLSDSSGQPVGVDRIEIVAFHHARRREAIELRLGRDKGTDSESEPQAPTPSAGPGSIIAAREGEYTWSLGVARAGLWQVRVRAQRGDERFVVVIDVESDQGAATREP